MENIDRNNDLLEELDNTKGMTMQEEELHVLADISQSLAAIVDAVNKIAFLCENREDME